MWEEILLDNQQREAVTTNHYTQLYTQLFSNMAARIV